MAAAKGKGNKSKAVEVPIEETVEEEVIENTEIETKAEQLEKERTELTDSYIRLAAEFDNFRKRTVREKDEIFKNATSSLIEAFLPVMDSMEMAKASVDDNAEKADLKKGIELVYRQFSEVLDKLDIDEIECLGEDFDPELHNAIMHVEDEKYGDNEVVEVLQKGYIFKEKVIRHSLVKVAN